MSKPGANLNLVLSVMVAMSRTGGSKELASILDEGVVWQGLLPELVCNGRGRSAQPVRKGAIAACHPCRSRRGRRPGGRRAHSADFPSGPTGTELEPPSGVRSFVFTFRDGKVVRMESFSSREAAFALVSTDSPELRARTRRASSGGRPPAVRDAPRSSWLMRWASRAMDVTIAAVSGSTSRARAATRMWW